MFKNPRRNSYENQQSCDESPIVISSLTPFVPSNTTDRDTKYDNQYTKLKHEFHTASQTRQNTATLTNNYSPTKRESPALFKKSIVFPEYEAQKQCLYVRPKGLLQVDPSRFQITPSELTMLRGKHHVQLSQVDVSTATGEVKMLDTPASLPSTSMSMSSSFRDSFPADPKTTTSSYSIQLPSSGHSSPKGAGSVSVKSNMHDSLAETEIDDCSSSASGFSSRSRSPSKQKKGYVIPLPRTYNKPTPYTASKRHKNTT